MPASTPSRWLLGARGRRRYAVACLLVGLALAIGLAVFLVPRSESSNGLSRLSNRGRAVAPSALGRKQLRQMPTAGTLRLLAIRGQRAFYRLDGAHGDCFSVGKMGIAGAVPGVTFCPAPGVFPSPSLPVAALPLVDAAKPSGDSQSFDPGDARLIRLDGFAADGVSDVEYVIAGRVVASAQVSGNVFSLPVAGLSAKGELVAKNAQGEQVFRQPF